VRHIPIRVYADTSVYGGVMDDEFETPSRGFFDEVRSGRFLLVVSAIVADELRDAPQPVRSLFESLRQNEDIADVTEEVLHLQQAYLDAAVVSAKWATDALHVAVATVAQCRLIVSWNFQHIVNFRRIPLYSGVNLTQGYGAIAIHTPQEVVAREDEDV